MKISTQNKISFICLSVLFLFFSYKTFSQSNSCDLIELAKKQWGTSIDKFPSALGLKNNEYSKGDNPANATEQVIMPKNQKLCEPKELPVLAYYFTKENGLKEIGGFYENGKFKSVVEEVTKRYGKYTWQGTAVGVESYEWHFDKIILSVSSVSWRIFQK